MRGRGTVSTLHALAATAALALADSHAAAQGGTLPVESIDLYGSRVLENAEVQTEIEPHVLRYVAMLQQASTPNADLAALEATALASRDRIIELLNARVPLIFVEISVIANTAPPPPHMNATVDVVEKADEAQRMPFRAAPTGELSDPDGLLAAWDEYVTKMFELALAGRPMGITGTECPVLHCIAPLDVPELASYVARFDQGAREHEDALYVIAAESANARHRANALFTLAHTNDADRLLPVLGRAIFDPAEAVRNNAMRVLMYMAQADAERDFPVDDLLRAFDFPMTSDRNKSGWTLVELAKSPRYRDRIRAEAVPIALRLLRLEQPINHEPAYELLKLLSGEKFDERDYAAWERWAASR